MSMPQGAAPMPGPPGSVPMPGSKAGTIAAPPVVPPGMNQQGQPALPGQGGMPMSMPQGTAPMPGPPVGAAMPPSPAGEMAPPAAVPGRGPGSPVLPAQGGARGPALPEAAPQPGAQAREIAPPAPATRIPRINPRMQRSRVPEAAPQDGSQEGGPIRRQKFRGIAPPAPAGPPGQNESMPSLAAPGEAPMRGFSETPARSGTEPGAMPPAAPDAPR